MYKLLLGLILLFGCSKQQNQANNSSEENNIYKKLSKIDSNTEFSSDFGDDIKLVNNNGWEYIIKDNKNGTFTFKVKDLKRDGVFDVSEYKNMDFGIDTKSRIRIAKTNLSYGHYGILESKFNYLGNIPVKSNNGFFLYQKDKETTFITKPEDMVFEGQTHAVLGTRKKGNKFSYKDLSGTAKMIIPANQNFGNLEFDFKDWHKVTAKNLNLENNTVEKWSISNQNIHFMDRDDVKPVIESKVLDNKEIIGSYKLNLQEGTTGYSIDGGFGIKK